MVANIFRTVFKGLKRPRGHKKTAGLFKSSRSSAPILLRDSTVFIGLAATGTGKTAAFAIPLLERINPELRVSQALVLCPTRELALQVAGQINLLGKHLGVKALPIYGGAGFNDQFRGLKAGMTVIVGTPGRLIDHLERGTLNLNKLTTLVLDEADEMISMGFKDDLEALLKAAPRKTSQIWLFSATMSPEVRRVADTYLRKPKQVQANKKEMLSTTVEQIYYTTKEGNKPEVICKIIDAADDFYGLIFCQTKSLVADLTRYLNDRGYKADCLHGDKDQKSRERTMQAFRNRQVSLLICTDVASRGLDVKDVTHVINYSIPRELDSYVHRIGRTARSGKTGLAMSLVTPSHRSLIPRIEKMTNSRMREGKIPSRREIGEKKVNQLLGRFKAQKSFARAVEMMGEAWKREITHMTTDEIVGRFLTMNFPEVFEGLEGPKHHPLTGDEPQREARREHRQQHAPHRRTDHRGPQRHPARPDSGKHKPRKHASYATKPHSPGEERHDKPFATHKKKTSRKDRGYFGNTHAKHEGAHPGKASPTHGPKKKNKWKEKGRVV